mgnify:CR=1 FL=1
MLFRATWGLFELSMMPRSWAWHSPQMDKVAMMIAVLFMEDSVRLNGLAAGRRVQVRLETVDAAGAPLASAAIQGRTCRR